MNMMRHVMMCLAVSLLSVPLAYGQDFSKYRNFSLGTSLTELSKQIDRKPADASVIYQSPALIQELTWSPEQSHQASAPSETVQQILFSFYNGNLYRIVVTYEFFGTEGLTAEDMVRAFSAKYGPATRPAAEANPPAIVVVTAGQTIAFWEDSKYRLNLSRFSLSSTFHFAMFSKQLNGQAEAAIAEAVKQEREDAPQRENALLKKAGEDLEMKRQANLKTFRP